METEAQIKERIRQYQMMVDVGSEPVDKWKKILEDAKAKLKSMTEE